MYLTALLLLPAIAHAQAPVLVSGFEPQYSHHQAIADRLPATVAKRLRDDPGLEVLLPSDVTWIEDKTGPAYLAACPDEQLLGCSFALAEVAEARWAITGIVRDEPVFDEDVEPGIEVELAVLDIEEQTEAWSLVLPYAHGVEAELAGWAQVALTALVEGREPPRPEPQVEPEIFDDEPDDPEADLSGLEREMGEVGHPEGVEDMGEGRQEREPMTMTGMMYKYGLEEPWEDMGLSPKEYLRWWNSGWGYQSWAQKRRGRKGKVTLRAHVGYGSGPRGGHYNAQYVLNDQSSRQVLEYYAWQSAVQGSGMSLGLDLGYGLAPWLEGELGLARHGGPFHTDVFKEFLGDEPTTERDEDGLQGTMEFSLGARVVPMPLSALRPQLGAGMLLWRGSDADNHADLPPVDLPVPAAATLLGAYGLLGAELAFNDRVGLLVQAPVQLFFGGNGVNIHDDDNGYIADKIEPPELPVLGWTVEAGVQLHLGG